MVVGYVVMRVSMVFLWWLVARDDPARAPAARKYIWTIGVAQFGWVSLAPLGLPSGPEYVVVPGGADACADRDGGRLRDSGSSAPRSGAARELTAMDRAGASVE